jgi:lysozyme
MLNLRLFSIAWNKRLRLAIAGAVVATVATTNMLTDSANADPLPLTYGEDISGHESDHDWGTSTAQFGIIKATEGLTFRDSTFARFWQDLGDKDIVRGAYHFAHPGNDPVAEADHFLSVVNAQPGKPGDLLVLDLEATDGESVAHVNSWAKTWLAHVKAKTGVTPMIYSGWHFANTYGDGLGEYPLWVAHYSKAPGKVAPPADWKAWAIHQYTDVPIDKNVSPLTPEQLRDLGR